MLFEQNRQSICFPFQQTLRHIFVIAIEKKRFWFLSFECNCITFESIYGIGPFFNSTHITFFQLWSLVFNDCLSLTQFRYCMFYLLITFIWYTFLFGPISNETEKLRLTYYTILYFTSYASLFEFSVWKQFNFHKIKCSKYNNVKKSKIAVGHFLRCSCCTFLPSSFIMKFSAFGIVMCLLLD